MLELGKRIDHDVPTAVVFGTSSMGLLFYAGAWQALSELISSGLIPPPDDIYTVSGSSIIAAGIAKRIPPQKMAELIAGETLFSVSRFARPLRHATGLRSLVPIEEKLQKHLGDSNVEDLNQPRLHIFALNTQTGRKEELSGPLVAAAIDSSRIPGLFEIGPTGMSDGGVTDAFPSRIAREDLGKEAVIIGITTKRPLTSRPVNNIIDVLKAHMTNIRGIPEGFDNTTVAVYPPEPLGILSKFRALEKHYHLGYYAVYNQVEPIVQAFHL